MGLWGWTKFEKGGVSNIGVPHKIGRARNSLPTMFKNCEPELSCILAELCNMCLKEFCFSDYWKVSSVVPAFKKVGERSSVGCSALHGVTPK